MPLPIVYYGTPCLRQKGAKVTEFNTSLRQLADEILQALHNDNGIGLAAQQVGHSIMLAVIDIVTKQPEVEFNYELDNKTPPIDILMPLVLVNPVLKLDKSETITYEEGCLSFPEIHAEVERPSTLQCNYQDLEGNPHKLVCDGILSRCIQHEVDHLNGILFIDRMKKSILKRVWPKLEEIKARRAS